MAIVAFGVLALALKRLTIELDIKAQAYGYTQKSPQINIYPQFCELIFDELYILKDKITNDTFTLKPNENKNQCIELLDEFIRKLNHIKSMNLSTQNHKKWEEELYGFLDALENFLDDVLENGKDINEQIRAKLMDGLASLKSPKS